MDEEVNSIAKILRDTMSRFVPSENLEPEDISYVLAVHYFAIKGYALIETMAYDKSGEEIAEVIDHKFDGNTFEMQVYWLNTARLFVEDVVFYNLGSGK